MNTISRNLIHKNMFTGHFLFVKARLLQLPFEGTVETFDLVPTNSEIIKKKKRMNYIFTSLFMIGCMFNTH